MKKSELKEIMCKQLIQNGVLNAYDTIRHSYTTNRIEKRNGANCVQSRNNISPTLDTRCDCIGVAVPNNMEFKRYKNYITWRDKKGNFNTECNRASLPNDLALTLATCNTSKVAEMNGGGHSMLRIRKLTPKEIIFYLMGLCGIIDTSEVLKNDEGLRTLLLVLWQEIGKKEIQQEIRRFWCIQEKEILRPELYEKSILKSWEYEPKMDTGAQFCEEYNEIIKSSKGLCDLWEKWKIRYTPHRWELSKQQYEQFNVFMSQLSYENTQEATDLYNLWEESERFGILQQTLYKIQEIWRSSIPQKQSHLRIRKLLPIECCRLMGADDSVDQKLREAGLSDMQRYHIYGDGLVVQIPQKIFERLK